MLTIRQLLEVITRLERMVAENIAYAEVNHPPVFDGKWRDLNIYLDLLRNVPTTNGSPINCISKVEPYRDYTGIDRTYLNSLKPNEKRALIVLDYTRTKDDDEKDQLVLNPLTFINRKAILLVNLRSLHHSLSNAARVLTGKLMQKNEEALNLTVKCLCPPTTYAGGFFTDD